jgi:polyisoprenyl-phosphate glycosyltransferase
MNDVSASAAPASTAPVAASPVTRPAGVTPQPVDGTLAVPQVQRLTATVVLPCYNEQDHVLEEIERITAAMEADGMSYELLVIDDASTDNTLEVLRGAQQRFPKMRLMPFRRNGGSGTARRIGTREARGDIVVWTDADMTYPNERIPEFVRMLLTDDSIDQVVGARVTEQGTHKWARVPAKFVIRKFAEVLTKQKIPDLNSGLRAFRRDVSLPYLRLLPPGFSCVTTLTISFLSNQHDIRYEPIEYYKRAGVSKFKFFKDAYRYILQVLRMVMYFDPLRILLPISLVLLGVGLVKLVYDQFQAIFSLADNTVLILVTGLLIGMMGLLADLIVRSRDSS